jgi:hypothetical protein
MTGLCAADLFHANIVAREMILSAGMGRKIGEPRLAWQQLRAELVGSRSENLGSDRVAGAPRLCLFQHTPGRALCCSDRSAALWLQ